MALSYKDRNRILQEVVLEKEPAREDTAEEAAYRKQTESDVEAIKKAGGSIDMENDWDVEEELGEEGEVTDQQFSEESISHLDDKAKIKKIREAIAAGHHVKTHSGSIYKSIKEPVKEKMSQEASDAYARRGVASVYHKGEFRGALHKDGMFVMTGKFHVKNVSHIVHNTSQHDEISTGKKTLHAPEGGITIRGVHFEGGEFIPNSVLAKAAPHEKAALGIQDKPKRAAPGSQMDEKVKEKLRSLGRVGTFPPADVPLSDIKMADLDSDPEELKYKPLIQWNQKTKSGRVSGQYRYTQHLIDRNAAQKFDRVSAIEPHVEKISKELTSIMSSDTHDGNKEAAAIASIIRETGLRPTDGADSVKHGHFGISSLQARHLKVKGDTIKLDFIGKEGVRNQTTVKEPANVAFLKAALEGKKGKDFIFGQAHSGHAGDLLKELSKKVGGPEDIKLKDLRTLKATQTAREVVSKFKGPPPPLSGNEMKDVKAIKSAILKMSGEVSKVLNNTPTQARDNYIHPEIFKKWQSTLATK